MVSKQEDTNVKIMNCVSSLLFAVDRAGGRAGDHLLNMTVSDFIANVAGPNSIIFQYVGKKEKDNG